MKKNTTKTTVSVDTSWTSLAAIVEREERWLGMLGKERTIEDYAKGVWKSMEAIPSVHFIRAAGNIARKKFGTRTPAATRLVEALKKAEGLFAKGMTSPDAWGRLLKRDAIFGAEEAKKAA